MLSRVEGNAGSPASYHSPLGGVSLITRVLFLSKGKGEQKRTIDRSVRLGATHFGGTERGIIHG